MGEKVKYLRSKPLVRAGRVIEKQRLNEERANMVLPVLAQILGVKLDDNG
jgi:hypothetical protein